MASLVSRNGKLYIDFRYKGIRYREFTGLADNKSNERQCKKLISKLQKQLFTNTLDYLKFFPNGKNAESFVQKSTDPNNVDLGDFPSFVEVWFREKCVEWRTSYQATIRISLDKYIIPYFEDFSLKDVSKRDILAFRLHLSQKPGIGGNEYMSPSRINHIMTPLRMILNEASDRYDFSTPWHNINALKVQRPQIMPFTLPEVRRLIRSIRVDYRPYLTVRFFTGMRTSEIDGLKWKYVDFDRKQILVREAWVQGKQVSTKTDGSMREIEMSSPVYDALALQKKKSKASDIYVFCSKETGKPIANRNFVRRIWYPLLEKLKLEARRPYQTRHTAATLWLASGENPEWIARQMGHTTTEMLFKVYSRYVPNLTRRDGSAFERLLTSRFKKPTEIDQ
jgi:integrase